MSEQNSLLLETIKIEEGIISNLNYHQARFDKSREILFNTKKPLYLASIIQAPDKKLYRCRVLYNDKIQSIEYIPYQAKQIRNIKLVSSKIDYSFKYADRTELDALLSKHNDADEILIEKNTYLTDTSISNIAFYDGKYWFTPKHPLLEGTMRKKLIDEGFLHTKNIRKETLSNYTHVALMNAMVGFKILKNITLYDETGRNYDY